MSDQTEREHASEYDAVPIHFDALQENDDLLRRLTRQERPWITTEELTINRILRALGQHYGDPVLFKELDFSKFREIAGTTAQTEKIRVTQNMIATMAFALLQWKRSTGKNLEDLSADEAKNIYSKTMLEEDDETILPEMCRIRIEKGGEQ